MLKPTIIIFKNKKMEDLATVFLQSRTQAHAYHLKVSGPGAYAIHMALGGYYDEIGDLIDGLVEAYQGKYGLINIKKTTGIVDNNATKENIIAYFDDLIEFLEERRGEDTLSDSWIQNELDNVAKLLYSTKYKLVNLG
jgi:Family of unknown function (DUF5856)